MVDNWLWLNPNVFEWQGGVQGSAIYTHAVWKRPHKIWAHAEQLLNKQTDEHERTNAIMALRRSIERRIRLLNERYSFRSIPIKEKPTDTLTLLEFVGIIRPRMLQKLIDIRNAVEHEDAEPPDSEMCQMFLEFTWYFLRSTDVLAQRVVDSLLFEKEEEERRFWIEVNMKPPDEWVPSIRGWVPQECISSLSTNEWLQLKVERHETHKEAVQRLDRDEKSNSEVSESYGWDNKDDDVYFSAELRGPSSALSRLYRLYFEMV